MTRFARAKGSKASNERIAEEATTWEEMKNQLKSKQREVETNKKRKEVECVRKQNYDKFVETVENEKANNTVWSEFPQESKEAKRSKKAQQSTEEVEETVCKKQTKTSKKKLSQRMETECESHSKVTIANNNSDDEAPQEISSKLITASGTQKKGKKRKVSKVVPLVIPSVKIEKTSKTEPVKNNKRDWSNMSEEEIKQRMDKLREKRRQRSQKMKEKKKLITGVSGETKPISAAKANVEAKPIKAPKAKPTRREKMEQQAEHKRRKPDPNPSTFINVGGEKVELVPFNGYPIRKEDAERLWNLKKQMISKGIPRKEVDIALKLERRRCEKALTRMKKNVCFNCRKSGHNLSECPQLGGEQNTETGICFKCGSTEHTHFECKVVRSTDFKFAQCFVCREQGHIASQCPENPRGLYPKGGACKLCGDVTHFKKDCPTLQTGEETSAARVGVLDDSCLEGLDEGNKKAKVVEKQRSVKKVQF